VASDEYGERRRRRRRRRRSSRERYDEDERPGEDGLEEDGERVERRSRRRERPTISLRSLLIWSAVLVTAVVLIGGGYWYYKRATSPAAKALADLRTLPMVGLVIADEPSVVDRLKEAIEEEARSPTPQGPTRPLLIVGELRRDYIAPAMRTADDASLLTVMAARAALVQHLRATNTAACREFSLGGIQHVDKLDAQGQQLFKNVLAAMEAAYRNGRANMDRKYPMPTLQAMGAMLTEAGFQKPDFDKLNSFATLSNDVSCDIELKLNQVPAKLPPEFRASFARYILGN
jgi:hypothetical protein